MGDLQVKGKSNVNKVTKLEKLRTFINISMLYLFYNDRFDLNNIIL